MSIYIFGSGGGGGTSGTDTSNDTIESKYVLNPYTFHDKNGNAGTGLIYNWDGTILAGGSTDGNKVTIQPSQSVRHIAAGSYINREIELAAMPAGSVALSQSGNKVTATKTAGYVTAGSQDLTIPAGTTTLRRSGATVYLDRTAGYVTEGTGVTQLTVPLASTSYNVTSNGTFSVPIPSGTAGLSALTIYASVAGTTPELENRSVTIRSNGTTTYYATSSNYAGMYSIKVQTSVVPSTGTGSVTTSGSKLVISAPSGKNIVSAGFVASSIPGTNYIVSGICHYNSTTGRAAVQTSSGVAVGNILSLSWMLEKVTITCNNSSYSFDGTNYIAYICYI